MAAPFHYRFVREDGRGYLPVFAGIVECRVLEGPGPRREHLADGDGPAVCMVCAVRVADGFTAASAFCVSARRLPIFAGAPFEALAAANFKQVVRPAWARQPAAPNCSSRRRLARRAPWSSSGVGAAVSERTMCMDLEAKAFFDRSDPACHPRLVGPSISRQLDVVTDRQESGFARGPRKEAWISSVR